MIVEHKHNNLVWLDLENPSDNEVREIIDRFNVAKEIGDDILSPTPLSTMQIYNDHFYVVAHFPALRYAHTIETKQEVDFIVGQNFIITVRYDVVDPLHKFAKLFDIDTILHKNNFDDHASSIFFYMFNRLYTGLKEELEAIIDDLITVERHIFRGHEKKNVHTLSQISLNLITFEEVLSQHKNILETLFAQKDKIFTGQFRHYIHSLNKQYHTLRERAQTTRTLLDELRQTNDSILSSKQNDIVQTLTVLTMVVTPTTLIASIFGMNTKIMPLILHPYGFWIIIIVMLCINIISLMIFKRKNWI